MQVAPQRGDLQLLSLLTATPFTRSFFAKNSSLLHLLILQRSHERILWSHMRRYYGLLMEDAICSVSDGRFGEWEVPCELLNR